MSHAEIGDIILKRFKISREICNAVRFHDADDRAVSKESDFELELITRVAVRIVDQFSLPEGDPLEIVDQLRGTIQRGREIYQQELREAIQSTGYEEVFPELLAQASRLIYGDLVNILQERSHPEARRKK